MMLNISVVIPLYNKNYSIVRCLNSVLYQTILPFEIIIVNDGSTDDSLAVLDDYLKTISVRDVNVIVHDQQNQGVSAARNNGIALAKSNYIALLDADDEWYPEHIEKMTTLIENIHGCLFIPVNMKSVKMVIVLHHLRSLVQS